MPLACLGQDIGCSCSLKYACKYACNFDSCPLLWSLCCSKKQLFPAQDGDRVMSLGVRLDEHKGSLDLGGVSALVWGICGI